MGAFAVTYLYYTNYSHLNGQLVVKFLRESLKYESFADDKQDVEIALLVPSQRRGPLGSEIPGGPRLFVPTSLRTESESPNSAQCAMAAPCSYQGTTVGHTVV